MGGCEGIVKLSDGKLVFKFFIFKELGGVGGEGMNFE